MLSEEGQYVLFVCEGSAEQYVLTTLIERDELSVPRDRIVRNRNGRWFLTRRESRDLDRDYLGVSYGAHPLLVIRIVDSDSDVLKPFRGYEHAYRVVNLRTHPEIEMLVIINEGMYADYTNKHKSSMMPSDYCKTRLGLRQVKKYSWLERYWAVPGDLERALSEYARLHRFRKGENRGLLELLK